MKSSYEIEQISKVISQIQNAYSTGLEYYKIGKLKLAEQEFVKILKPVVSKPSLKNLYINTEQVKAEVLGSIYHLGLLYQENKQSFDNYSKAAAIFQYCAGFAKKYKIGKAEDFLKEAYETEAKFLASIGRDNLAKNVRSLDWYYQELNKFRDSIESKINNIENYQINDISTITKEVEEIYKDCTKFFVNNPEDKKYNFGFIQQLLNDCFKQLGPLPEGCEYAVLGLGSLAGGRMTPWSDLEFAILINKDRPEYKEYFRNLTKLLHIKVINLGETPLRSVGAESLNNFKIAEHSADWFWDDILKNGFSFDGPDWHACKTPLGRQGGYQSSSEAKRDFELILTPQQLAEFQQEQVGWFKSDIFLVQGLRLVLLIDGNQKLLDNYREQIKTTDETGIIKHRALTKLAQDINSFSLKLGDEEEGKLIDVKKDIFRICDRIIDDLANYYFIMAEEGEPGLTAWEVLDQMQNQGILSHEGAKHLKEALSISSWLRIATYCYNQGQSETLSTYQPAVEHLTEEQVQKLLKETFYIKDISILNHFYYVIIELQALMAPFCNDTHHPQAEFILRYSRLFDDSAYSKGMVHARFLEYDKALKCLEIAKQEGNQGLVLLQDLYFLYTRTAKIDQAIKLAEETLRLFQSDNQLRENVAYLEAAYNNLGNAYVNKANYDKAEDCYNEVLKISLERHKLNLNHSDIADTYANLGKVCKYKGEDDKAIEYFKKTLEIEKKCYKQDNHYIADNYRELGIIYSHKKEYDKAIEFFNQALKIELEFYKNQPNHPSIAITYNNLGCIYLRSDKYDLAIQYFSNALAIRFKIYEHNTDHPDIAGTYNNLGNLYKLKGQYSEALSYYNKALELDSRIYKFIPNHPDIAEIYNNLGSLYLAKDEYNQAEKCYEKAIEIRLKAYENYPKHYTTIADTYNNLMLINKDKGECKKVAEYYEKALRVIIKTYDDCNKPEIANSYGYMAELYQNAANYTKALEYSQKALEIKCILQNYFDNSEMVAGYNQLGNAYYYTGNYKEAYKYYEKALVLKLKVYNDNPNHPNVAVAYNNLAIIFDKTGEHEKALQYYEKALNIRIKVYGPEHSEVADSYNNTAIILKAMGNIDQAISYIQKSIEIRFKIGEQKKLADSYDNLGTAYANKKEYQNAIENCEEALKLYIQYHKNNLNHPDIGNSYNNLGIMYLQKNMPQKAEDYLAEALKVKLKVYEDLPNHPSIAGTYCNLGTLCLSNKKYFEAVWYFSKALNIFYITNPNAPEIKGILKNLEIASIMQETIIPLQQSMQKPSTLSEKVEKIEKEPLIQAIIDNDQDMVLALILSGVNLNQPTSSNTGTAMHIAYSQRNMEIIKLLLHNRADINARDSVGKTPLHYLLEQKDISDEVKMKLIQDKDLRDFYNFTIKDNQDRTILDYAIEYCSETLTAIILSLCPLFNESEETVEAINNSDATSMLGDSTSFQ